MCHPGVPNASGFTCHLCSTFHNAQAVVMLSLLPFNTAGHPRATLSPHDVFQLVDMFHSLSLKGYTDLTPVELEMALNLVDGLDLTRREVSTLLAARSFVRALLSILLIGG